MHVFEQECQTSQRGAYCKNVKEIKILDRAGEDLKELDQD